MHIKVAICPPPLVRSEVGVKDGGYIHHLVLCSGPLFKKSSSNATSTGMGHLQFRKRYFELSNQALSYSQSEKKAGVSHCSPFGKTSWEMLSGGEIKSSRLPFYRQCCKCKFDN